MKHVSSRIARHGLLGQHAVGLLLARMDGVRVGAKVTMGVGIQSRRFTLGIL